MDSISRSTLQALLGGNENLDTALNLAARGFSIFPADALKKPLVKWRTAATTDPEQIRRWWDEHPGAIPALPCGEMNGVAVLDLDRHEVDKDGVAAMADVEATFTVETPSGGRHLYYQHVSGLSNAASHLPPGVDVRGEGGYVIAPGAILPGGRRYRAFGDVGTLSPFPHELRPPRNLTRILGAPKPHNVDWPTLSDALAAIDPDDREIWLRVGMGLHYSAGGEDQGYRTWCNWSHGSRKFDAKEQRKTWDGFGKRRGAMVTAGTIFDIAAKFGWQRPALEVSADEFEDLPEVTNFEREGVMRTTTGAPKATQHNAIVFLGRANARLKLALRHDEMSGRDYWRRGEVDDEALTQIRVAIEREGLHSAGADLTANAVRSVARRNAYHPVRDWLESLNWDGVYRLDTWLSDYLKADVSPYVRAVGRAFLVGMVARIMRPGCKHDHVLVLSGGQGIGKSTACRVLGGPWYGDNMPSIRDGAKEAGLYLRGHWLIEMAELTPSRKAEAEDLKSFLTRAEDEIRAPYARKADRVPRQCVFVGTTNEDEFLRDASGGRRFWPVACGAQIDTDALAKSRDQLFAEAVAAFKDSEAWHLPYEIELLAAAEQEAAREADPWEEVIQEYLEHDEFDGGGRVQVTLGEVLRHLGIPVERQRGHEGKRASQILRRFGWTKHHTKKGKEWRAPDGM